MPIGHWVGALKHCVPVPSNVKPGAHVGIPVVPQVPRLLPGQFVQGLLPVAEYVPAVHGIGLHEFDTESNWKFV